MTDLWVEAGKLTSCQDWPVKPKDKRMILMGPGGTGKTTLLKAAEAMIDFFTEKADSVRKCAISNAAAR